SSGSDVFPQPSGLDLNYTQPGPNSLTCLSCHDGATAIDSIINMPTQLNGEFRAGYSKSQETAVNSTFLDAWSGNKLGTTSPADANIGGSHANFGNTGTGSSSYCVSCHNPGIVGARGQGPDFRVLVIGDKYSEFSATNFSEAGSRNNYLADDHPIGVEYPKDFSGDIDYNEPDVKLGKIAFFDLNGNRHADPNEVRLYNTGDGYEVECGSCHDPHGVRVSETSNELIPSFLRVGARAPLGVSNQLSNAERDSGRQFIASNTGSGLCLPCHVK
ncbi:MAG: hypothetical protein R3240_03700, partial [Gammaproteobacteria bacterium]|nr:hypothetical protein [Gammaproteobacteria bacterium]